MKVLYILVFFLDMLLITALAYGLFQGIDNGSPMWVQGLQGLALVVAIGLLVLFIRRYVRGEAGSKGK